MFGWLGGAATGGPAGPHPEPRYYPDRRLHLIVLTNAEILSPDPVQQRLWDAATID